jgi:hypothetical protein
MATCRESYDRVEAEYRQPQRPLTSRHEHPRRSSKSRPHDHSILLGHLGCPQVEDMAGMQACNLQNLPENYTMKYCARPMASAPATGI